MSTSKNRIKSCRIVLPCMSDDLISEINDKCRRFGYPEVNRDALAKLPLQLLENIIKMETAPLLMYGKDTIYIDSEYLHGFDTPENLSKYFYLRFVGGNIERHLASVMITINIEDMKIRLSKCEKTLTVDEYLRYSANAPSDEEVPDYWYKIFEYKIPQW